MSEIELPEPAAWLVKAQYPFVEMRPPIEGGLPREPLFTAEQVRQLLAAEKERCARVCEMRMDEAERESGPEAAGHLEWAAAAIRRGSV